MLNGDREMKENVVAHWTGSLNIFLLRLHELREADDENVYTLLYTINNQHIFAIPSTAFANLALEKTETGVQKKHEYILFVSLVD